MAVRIYHQFLKRGMAMISNKVGMITSGWPRWVTGYMILSRNGPLEPLTAMNNSFLLKQSMEIAPAMLHSNTGMWNHGRYMSLNLFRKDR